MTEEKSTAMSQLRGELVGRTIGPGLHILPGQGNAFAIETAAGVFLVDAGSRATAPRMLLVDGPRRSNGSPRWAPTHS